MTGVEILSTAEVAVTAFQFDIGIFFLSWFLITLFGTFVGWIADKNNRVNGWFTGLLISCILGFVLSIGLGMTPFEPAAYETQYKITVSDEVSMNKFLARYEIIDQEGKVYIVRERDDYVPSETEKTGHWTGWENSECSECGQFNVMVYSGKHLNYCPDCGTKMDGGDGT